MSKTHVPEQELVEELLIFLGEDGVDFFKTNMEVHGTYTPVTTSESYNINGIERALPHAVHFREGMQVRNFLRGAGIYGKYGLPMDVNLDDVYVNYIGEALKSHEEKIKNKSREI